MPKKIIKDGKEHVIFDPTNEEDMRIALGTAQKTLEANEGGQSKEQFEKEAEIEAKLSKAEEGTKLFDELKSKIEQDYTEKGLRMPNITDNDSMEDAMQNLKQIEKLEANQKQKPEITGSAPLEGNIRYSQGYKEGYSSQAELIEDLRSKSRLGGSEGAQAEQILGQLLVKSLKGVKEGKRGFGEIKTPIDGETEIQRLNRIWREKQLRNRNRD